MTERPKPVELVAPTPVPVEIVGDMPAPVHAPLPATTTAQEDITTAGQRRVNMIWEFTQASIALMVIIANMIVGISHGVGYTTPSTEYPIILSSSLFLIVGFYFSRTNHAAIGGVGFKPNENQKYKGR